jgi:hypothetical protein
MKSNHFLIFCLLLFINSIICKPGGQELNPYKGTKIGNVTVYGAMILTDPDISAVLGRDFHRVPQGVNGTTSQNAQWRIENGKHTASQLPFHVDFW